MAKRKQQDEEMPSGPGIAGIFNEAPLYYLPGTPGDVGALAIDYPTMRAEPWSQTAAPIPTPSSPQGEILAAPSGAAAPVMATGQDWKNYFSLLGNEIDLYRQYMKNYHELGGQYFPQIIATGSVPKALIGSAGWYDDRSEGITIPIYSYGYSAGDYTDTGATTRQTPSGGYEKVVPVITDPKNPKMSIRMDKSPLPHEIGHYYDFTGGSDYEYYPNEPGLANRQPGSISRSPARGATSVRSAVPLTRQYNQMSWSDQPKVWEYILANTAGAIRPYQALDGDQSWFEEHGIAGKRDVPAEVFADYFQKAMQAGVIGDMALINKLYGGKAPVKLQVDMPNPGPPPSGTPEAKRYEQWVETVRKSAAEEAGKISAEAKRSPNATRAQKRPVVFDAVTNLSDAIPPYEIQARMRPMLTDQAREFLYWLFTRGYNPQ